MGCLLAAWEFVGGHWGWQGKGEPSIRHRFPLEEAPGQPGNTPTAVKGGEASASSPRTWEIDVETAEYSCEQPRARKA